MFSSECLFVFPIIIPPPPPSAGGLNLPYTVENGISATGTTLGGARGLTAQDNEVTGSTAGSALGVIITLITPGIPTIVHNYSGNAINLYPPSGGQINHLGTGVAYVIQDGSSMEFHCMTATQWYSTSP